MKNKKSVIAIFALILVVLVGVTIAYFTSSASFVNEFTTGTYKVTTTEVFESPDNWKPGEEIPKTITTTNEGTIPAAVRVSYTEQWLDGDTDITDDIDEGTAIINLDNTSDWTREGNYYYYNYILNPNETTSSFIKSVTLNPALGDDDDTECTTSNNGLTVTCEGTNPALGAKYILTLTKETVQADKYQEVWDTDVEISVKSSPVVNYCPNCIFAKNTDDQHNGSLLEVDTTNTVDSYSDIFLGYIKELNDYDNLEYITRGFACAKLENNYAICVEGWNSDYSDNKDILDEAEFNCTYSDGEYKCTKNMIEFRIFDYVGDVYVSNGTETCSVDRDGYAFCYNE